MQGFLLALGTPPLSDYFLAFCVAVMILPMVVLARWYHNNIGRTQGGRDLMQRQNRANVRAPAQLLSGIGMMRDIASGRYGSKARRMQIRVYQVVAAWLFANLVCFGLLLWAQEVAKQAAKAQ